MYKKNNKQGYVPVFARYMYLLKKLLFNKNKIKCQIIFPSELDLDVA